VTQRSFHGDGSDVKGFKESDSAGFGTSTLGLGKYKLVVIDREAASQRSKPQADGWDVLISTPT
jgi:hypothetical protein